MYFRHCTLWAHHLIWKIIQHGILNSQNFLNNVAYPLEKKYTKFWSWKLIHALKFCLFRIHTSITIWIVVIVYGEYAIATVPIRVPDLCMLDFFVRDLRYKIIESKMKYVLSH